MRKFTLIFAAIILVLPVSAQDFVRRAGMAMDATSVPVMDAVREEGIYRGRDYPIDRWVNDGTPVEGVSANYYLAYDNDNIYVFVVALVPEKTPGQDEVGILVALDSEDYQYSWEVDPLNENGAVFSKAVFGGEDEEYSVQPDEAKTVRQFTYIYSETVDGYEVEVLIPWANLSTDAALIADAKARGKIFFDVGIKLAADENKYFAWSNNDNNIWQQTNTAGIVALRRQDIINLTATVPALDGIRETEVYPGEGKEIKNWVNEGAPAEGVSAKFWYSYDNDNLYVYSEAVVPNKSVGKDEVGIVVSIDELDFRYAWEVDPLNENGAVFSKAVFGGADGLSIQPDEPLVLRQFEYIFSESTEGYEVEVKIPWANLTTNAELVNQFKTRKKFFFDIGYKLEAQEHLYFAWSNNDNSTWEKTHSAAVVSLWGATSVKNMSISSLSVYPNPVNDVLNISLKEPGHSAFVFDLVGRKVLSVELNGSSDMDVSSLKGGVYILKVNFASGNESICKFIKR